MTADELQIDIKKQKIVGNAYATITICTLILMGLGVYQFTDHLSHQEAMLSRIESRNGKVSDLRINQCHQIQKDSVSVMRDVSKAIAEHHRSIDKLNNTVGALQLSVDRNTAKIEQLIMK